RDEWEFWTSEPNLSRMDRTWASFAQKNLLNLQDRFELIEDEQEVFTGINAVPAPGHTPGHGVLFIASAGEELITLGDAAGHPIHLEHPEWHILSDQVPEEAMDTRRRLLERASSKNALLFGYHFPFPGLGRALKKQKGWDWEPIGGKEMR
ncbi:MBL fold metallo-hydrolase, partial [Thermodesulfobacteriota bacterium]